eukprot:gene1696-51_t
MVPLAVWECFFSSRDLGRDVPVAVGFFKETIRRRGPGAERERAVIEQQLHRCANARLLLRHAAAPTESQGAVPEREEHGGCGHGIREEASRRRDGGLYDADARAGGRASPDSGKDKGSKDKGSKHKDTQLLDAGEAGPELRVAVEVVGTMRIPRVLLGGTQRIAAP